MRKHYVDNIRWITVILVVIYHVIYMYNGVIVYGVIGPFYEVQYQDGIQYILYPWFMVILFIISGMSSRYYLESHAIKEFVAARTRKLLVPSTIGLFVFHWILGYFNMSISNAFETMPDTIPKVFMYLIMSVSGIGVLWYIQMLWIFSMGLGIIRRMEKGRLYNACKKINIFGLVILGVLVWASAQILNTPIITVYRFGIYGVSFLLGYFVFAHEEVMEKLSKYWHILLPVAVALGCVYVYHYFGENYAEEPVVNSPFSIMYGWIAILAIFAVMKRWGDKSNSISTWMSKKSFGLYVFHYLPLAAAAYVMDKMDVTALPAYIIAGVVSFAGGYLLYEAISRIPLIRWCVLGIKKKEKKNVQF